MSKLTRDQRCFRDMAGLIGSLAKAYPGFITDLVAHPSDQLLEFMMWEGQKVYLAIKDGNVDIYLNTYGADTVPAPSYVIEERLRSFVNTPRGESQWVGPKANNPTTEVIPGVMAPMLPSPAMRQVGYVYKPYELQGDTPKHIILPR